MIYLLFGFWFLNCAASIVNLHFAFRSAERGEPILAILFAFGAACSMYSIGLVLYGPQ